MTQPDPPPLMFRVATAVALALLISIIARSAVSWKYWGDLDHNSPGSWLCMAQDASQGVLYRPLVSNLGYGGTRYAPLFPIIIAAFMHAGFGVVTSGFLASLLATAVAVTGLFLLVRRLDVPLELAVAMPVFMLAATCTRTIILGIKGDLLATGLTLWGLAMVVRASGKRESALSLIAGALFFVLAVAVKITSIFGIAAVAIWWVSRKKSRETASLFLMWLAGIIIAAVLVQAASDGRASTIFHISATGGGGLARLLQGPRLMFGDMARQDRTLMAIWLISVFLIAATGRWSSLPSIYLLISTAGTIVIYGSPGTHLNHLVDMNAASILVIATLRLKNLKWQSAVLVCTLLLMCMAAWACWRQLGEIRHNDQRGQMLAAVAGTESSSREGPILSENPLLPMLQGQRSYMLDPFLFRAIRARHPEFANQFWHDLAGRRFKAVILHGPPDDPDYSSNEYDFGPGFIDRLESQYVQTSVHGNYYVFLPK